MLDKAAQTVFATCRRIAGTVSPAPGVPRTSIRGGEQRRRVMFVNDLWGYGSVTMAMAVAGELEGECVRLFAGMGPSFELARRATCFDRLLRIDTMTSPVAEELDRTLSTCHAVVSVMNLPLARRAAQRGLPCLYVDSLLWMWATPPDLPPEVPYCQERFPGAERRLRQWRHHLFQPEIVGPLVARSVRRRSVDPDAVLVNFGAPALFVASSGAPW